jgi:ribonuclease HI
VPGHHGILGNEIADKLARQASAMPLLGPDPALGMPKRLAREAIKSWTVYQHSKNLEKCSRLQTWQAFYRQTM